ncbi:MAG: DUF805 domain-containing protein [Proteobacteria bacterium]|nr:DUF805 domain-containing protein [Pseudomonadota bacterium]MDE2412717.1 DUF805 domain-containing protein [Sphingomonadales bacterium]
MTFGEAIRTCFSKFTTWQGRASRSEYWWFVLFGLLCQIVAAIVDRILGTAFTFVNPATGATESLFYGWFYLIMGLVLLLPHLAVMVRRLHDTNRSGWWYWIALIPLIGVILLIVWLASRGTEGSNNYGSDPFGGDLGTTFG